MVGDFTFTLALASDFSSVLPPSASLTSSDDDGGTLLLRVLAKIMSIHSGHNNDQTISSNVSPIGRGCGWYSSRGCHALGSSAMSWYRRSWRRSRRCSARGAEALGSRS